jgi:hypothetical protein
MKTDWKPSWKAGRLFGQVVCLTFIFFIGCAAQTRTGTSLDAAQLKKEDIQSVAILTFDGPQSDPQAGPHISYLFETYLLPTGYYKIVERGTIEKALIGRGYVTMAIADLATIRQVAQQLKVDGVILGSVSQYGRSNLGFTARLVSVKSGLVLWSLSQTGGDILRPLSQVADETVRKTVEDLKVKLR